MKMKAREEKVSDMKKAARQKMVSGMGIVRILIVIVFLSGPRVDTNIRINPLILPEDLDQYLAESESEFNDIIPGAEKKIFWAGKKGVQTPYSLVYLHGFSACRQETAPLSEIVAEKLGANLFYTRFKGHGRTGDAMLEGSVDAWLKSLEI